MAQCFENFNLGFLGEDEENYVVLMAGVSIEGAKIVGYYGLPYYNRHFGQVQMVVKTEPFEDELAIEEIEKVENKKINRATTFAGLDTHASGNAIWDVVMDGFNIDREDRCLLDKRVVVKRPDGQGVAVVNLINADVLPSFLEGDKIKIQMIALPMLIEYYEDEESYANSQQKNEKGECFCLGEGVVLSSGFFRNRNPDSDEYLTDDRLDDITIIRGTVRGLYHGVFELNGEKHNAFIRCRIDTEFGPLDILHTADQVKEEQIKNLKVGATVVAYAVLSGDVAIYEYDKGVVRDEEHNLAALRYMFAKNDPERIRSILREDATYRAEYNNMEFVGRDAIIERLKLVQKNNKKSVHVDFGRIVSVDEGEKEVDYGVGKRCLLIMQEGDGGYYSVVFIDMDEDGYVSRLVTSTNGRYHFAVDREAGGTIT